MGHNLAACGEVKGGYPSLMSVTDGGKDSMIIKHDTTPSYIHSKDVSRRSSRHIHIHNETRAFDRKMLLRPLFLLVLSFRHKRLVFFLQPILRGTGFLSPRSSTSPSSTASCFLFPFSSFVSLSHTPLPLFAAALHSSLNLIRDTCSTLLIVGPFSAKRHYDGRIVHDERCDFGHLSRVGAQQVASTTIDTSTTLL